MAPTALVKENVGVPDPEKLKFTLEVSVASATVLRLVLKLELTKLKPFKLVEYEEPDVILCNGKVEPSPKLPEAVILAFSVGKNSPSGVVKKTILPGASFVPGTPSTSNEIFADLI